MLDLATPDELVDEASDEAPRRRVNHRSAVVTVVLVIALIAAGGMAYAALPAAHQLGPAPVEVSVPDSARNAQAAIATDRLAVAAGRNLAELAEAAPGSRDTAAATGAATVGGAQASSGKYAETLAELTAAEEAAAAQLAMTEQEVAAAERQRKEAAAKRAQEEERAAQAVDDAVAAAIAAAQAQSSAAVLPYDAIVGSGGGSSSGASTNTQQVHDLVAKYFPADEIGNAMAISRCESGHANRVSGVNANGTRDYGVFQINDGGTLQAALRRLGIAYSGNDDARQKALDPALNVRMARVIWESRGWQPWTCAAKMQVVAGLYQRTEGPMSGKYDEFGRA